MSSLEIESCPCCYSALSQSDPNEVVSCPACRHKTCRECVKKYLVAMEVEPRCMSDSCRHPWSYSFLNSILPRTFLYGKFAKHQLAFLEARENQFMLEARGVAHEQRNIMLRHMRVRELKNRINVLRNQMDQMDVDGNVPKTERYQLKKPIKVRLDELKEQLAILTTPGPRNRGRRVRGPNGVEMVYDKEQKEPVSSIPDVPCPKETCRGMIDKDSNACSMCKQKVCSRCAIQLKDQEEEKAHKCDPNTLKTLKMLQKGTKPCPKCASPIYKTEGCDQMHCVKCHHNFSWTTLKPIVGFIHNEYYFAWRDTLAKQNEEKKMAVDGEVGVVVEPPVPPINAAGAAPVGAVAPCAEDPLRAGHYACQNRTRSCNGECRTYNEVLRILYHHLATNWYFKRLSPLQLAYSEATNREARIEYCMGDISLTAYRQKLVQSFREMSYKQEKRQILDTLRIAVTDLCAKARADHNNNPIRIDQADSPSYKTFNESITYLLEYFSKQFQALDATRGFSRSIVLLNHIDRWNRAAPRDIEYCIDIGKYTIEGLSNKRKQGGSSSPHGSDMVVEATEFSPASPTNDIYELDEADDDQEPASKRHKESEDAL